MDFSLDKNLRGKLAKDIGGLVQEFCQVVGNDHVMRRLEEAFTYHLKAYAQYTNSGLSKSASDHRQEVRQLIKRTEQLSKCSA